MKNPTTEFVTTTTRDNDTTMKEELTMKLTNNETIIKEDVTMDTTRDNDTTTNPAVSSKKMFAIRNYNAFTEHVELNLHRTNNAFRYAISKGFNPTKEFIFVDSIIELFDKETEDKKAHWRETVKSGITVNGKLYKPLAVSASGAKYAKSIWCVAEHVKMYSKKFRHGFNINGIRMEPNKFFTRLGLAFTSSDPIEEVYGKPVNFEKFMVIADVYRDKVCRSDGLIIHFGGDSNLETEAHTVRIPKGLEVPVNTREFLDAIGGDQEKATIWGKTFRLAEAERIAFESAFKWANLCRSQEQFVAAMKEDDLAVAVRMNKHGVKHLTYQPLQTLNFSKESISKLCLIGKKYLDSLKDIENYVKLLPPEVRQSVAMYPALSKDAYISEAGQTGYRKQKMILRGAAVPNAGKFFAICPDIIDLFGGNGLKAGECCIHGLPEGKLVLVRYPHTSAASFVVLYNRHIKNGIKDPNVLCLNNYDDSLRRLGGADYDGDKVFVILDEEVKQIVLDTLDEMGHLEMPPALEGKAQKLLFNPENAEEIKVAYFASLTQRSQIGSVSNKLSAAYAALHEAYILGDDEAMKFAKSLVLYYQLQVEVVVDKEKHGSTFIAAPKGLKNMNKKLCEFVKFAKLAKKIGTAEKLVIDPSLYEQRLDCPMEQYSVYINENTCKASEFALDVDDEFMWANLMFEGTLPHINIKVFHRGEPIHDENGEIVRDENGKPVGYINQGTFDKLVFANVDELVELAKKHGYEIMTSIEMRTALIDELMHVYAEHYECKAEDVYNAIVFYIYSIENENIAKVYKRVFWECLHEYAERALAEKFGTKALEMDLESIDECSEVDDEEMDY